MARIAIFIDGAYLEYLLKEEFGAPRIDFKLLVKHVSENRELLRAYYYDCLPFQSEPPSAEERLRFSRRQGFHSALTRIPRFQLRLGKLARRHDNGKLRYEQKRVDILLGVDLVQLAAKHRITDAALIAGDSDFLPAIEVAKSEGVVVHLFHGRAPHDDLRICCDERTRIDRSLVEAIRLQ
jgi:uncharacterized LabA/DUF88 family protein